MRSGNERANSQKWRHLWVGESPAPAQKEGSEWAVTWMRRQRPTMFDETAFWGEPYAVEAKISPWRRGKIYPLPRRSRACRLTASRIAACYESTLRQRIPKDSSTAPLTGKDQQHRRLAPHDAPQDAVASVEQGLNAHWSANRRPHDRLSSP